MVVDVVAQGTSPLGAPEATFARALARAVVAFVATELAALALLAAALRGLHGLEVPGALALHALGVGLAGGAAYGVADALAARRPGRGGLALALLAGAALAAAAPVAGELALAVLEVGAPEAALEVVVARLAGRPRDEVVASVALFVGVALALHAPVLLARARGAGLLRQAGAAALGAAAAGVAVGLLGRRLPACAPDALGVSEYALWLLPRCLLVPVGLRLGDGLVDRARRAALGDEALPARIGAAPIPSGRPADRPRAARHAAQGEALLAAGRPAEAAAALGQAWALWPTPERARSLARARALAGDPEGAAHALAALRALADRAVDGGAGVDPRDPAWAAALGHAAFDAALAAAVAAAAVARPAATGRARLGWGPTLAGCAATAGLVGVVAPAALVPGEPAAVTLGRVEAWALRDGAAWVRVGDEVASGRPLAGGAGLGLLRALADAGLCVGPPGEAPARAAACYLRGADLGVASGLRRAAEQLTGLPDRRGEAAALLRRAAEGGDPAAMLALARVLRVGLGVPADADAARRWTDRARAAAAGAGREDAATLAASGPGGP